jgi:N-acetylmuramic acid 6-phosphate etherase
VCTTPAPRGRAELRDQLAALVTEARDATRPDLDTLATVDLVRAMNNEDALVPREIGRQAFVIAAVVDALVERMRAGGRLIYVGAGTAGRIGVLDASECPPTFGTDPTLVVGIIAGGETALRNAVEDSEDDRDSALAGVAALDVSPADTVVGISASGRTPFVLAALEEARRRGCLTVAVAANHDSEIGRVADHAIETVVGPEFVAGSTRLKAGTAQKLVLNMLSTIAMVRLGKTFNGVMVHLQATNEKLRARSERMVMEAAGVRADEASDALARADGSVKVAIVMLLAGASAADARAALDRQGDLLARAVADLTPET